MGGQWQNANPNVPTLNPIGNCFTPDVAPQAPAPAPVKISVSVPTNVNTQVSPQISPNLIQQQQPQNSPVNASTAQDQAPQVVTPTPVIVTPAPTSGPDTSNDAATQALLDLISQQAGAAQMPIASPSVSYVPEPSAAPAVVAPATNYAQYLPYALIAAGVLFFAMNNKQKKV